MSLSKRLIIGLLSLLPLLTSAQDGAVTQEFRTFTSNDGKKLQAVLFDRDDENKTVTLLLKGNKRRKIPLNRLSEEDQQFAKEWSRDKAIFLRECRTLTARQLLELRGYEPIKFRFESNAIVIEGKINGHPGRCKVDTGAHTTILHIPYVEAAECKVGPLDQRIYGVAGFQPAGYAEIPTIEIGSALFKDQEILAADRNFNMPKGTKNKTDILLGAEYLTRLEAVISYKERLLFIRPDKSDRVEIEEAGQGDDDFSFRIFKTKDGKRIRGRMIGKTQTTATIRLKNGKKRELPFYNLIERDAEYAYEWSQEKATFLQHCRSLTIEELLELREYQSFKYERHGNHIYVDGTIVGDKVTWMIDTGADNSLIHLDYAQKLGLEIGEMKHKVYGIGGWAPAAATKLPEIILGNATLTNRRLLTTDMQRHSKNKELPYVGLFGADYMRELDAVITYRESRIFLKQQ